MLQWFPEFAYPELLLLGVPLWYCYARWGRAKGVTGWIRLLVAGLLLLALSGPSIRSAGEGVDVVVVVDRSISMPPGSGPRHTELIAALEEARGTGDRLGIVTFGVQSHVERPLSNSARLQQFVQVVEPDGSDLSQAVASALSLTDVNRPTRLLLLTDGENNGRDISPLIQQAVDLKIPVDHRLFERLVAKDAAVEMVELPTTVLPGEPFQFSVYVQSDEYRDAVVEIFREDTSIARKTARLKPGRNRLVFRDRQLADGLIRYTAKMILSDDAFTENNTASGVVLVQPEPRLLVLNIDGHDDNLVRAIRAGDIQVDVHAAASHPLTAESLDRYRAVVLEDVRATSLGRIRMESLARFVDELGGGLMMTGGRNSFGVGGYYNSPIDPLLPVSMELRDEDRADHMANVIVLDRSGSMKAPVGNGQTKMDLANLGTAASVRLLAPGDSVAVIAVDTAPEVIVPLSQVDNAERMANRASNIESQAGGIYVYEALVAAQKELRNASQSTKHILLFSDASDSENPGDYRRLLETFKTEGITVSVIGLGTPKDPDARLLQDIAARGEGTIMFTNDARELPRLFTEDTMNAAQSSFVTADPRTQPGGIPGQPVSTIQLIGNLDFESFPSAGGYNLSYLRPDAMLGVVSNDKYNAPWSAFRFRETGRTVALTLEVDGEHTGQFGRWDEYANFLVTHARWLLSGEDSEGVFVDIDQNGQNAKIRIEFADARRDELSEYPPVLKVIPPNSNDEVIIPDLTWTGAQSLEANVRLDRAGTWRTLIKTSDKQFARGPAVTLPYSPEYMPRNGLPSGREFLTDVSGRTDGKPRADVTQVFRDPPRAVQRISLVFALAIAALVLHVLEIAGRRLDLWPRRRQALEGEESSGGGWQWKRSKRSRMVSEVATPESQPAESKPNGIYDEARRRAKARIKE